VPYSTFEILKLTRSITADDMANTQPSVLPFATLAEFFEACTIKTGGNSQVEVEVRECYICMGSDQASMVAMPCCRQEFHRDCLTTWLEGREAKGRCPHCRAQLVTYSEPETSEVLVTDHLEFATAFNRRQDVEGHALRLVVDEFGGYSVAYADGDPDDRDDESDESDDCDDGTDVSSGPGDFGWGSDVDYV